RGGNVEGSGYVAIAILGKRNIAKRSVGVSNAGGGEYIGIAGSTIKICVDTGLAFGNIHLAFFNRILGAASIYSNKFPVPVTRRHTKHTGPESIDFLEAGLIAVGIPIATANLLLEIANKHHTLEISSVAGKRLLRGFQNRLFW